MNRVTTQQFPSEATLLKRENRLLWAIVLFQCLFLYYMDQRNEQVKAHTTPQSVMAACTKAIGAN